MSDYDSNVKKMLISTLLDQITRSKIEDLQMEANTPSSVPVPSSSNLSKPPLTSKKKSRKTSDVWDHFTRNLDNPNDPMAICNYCDKSYVGGNRSSGTSTLRGHMVNQCPNNPFRIEDKKQKTLIFQKMMGGKNKSVEGANLKAVGFSQSDCRIACVKMIILDELSFSIACPKFDIPSRITVSRDIKKLYCDEKKKLQDYFIKHSQRVSLTTDTWTSIQNISGVVRSSSPIHPNHITPGLNRQDSNLRPHPLIAHPKGCYHQLSCSSIGDSSPWDVLLKGEVSGSSLTNNLPCRFKPGVIWLGCIGLLDLTTPEILSV
ncbi:hypothetical protein LXL04_033770 [Taraxacum kok-saghyz]